MTAKWWQRKGDATTAPRRCAVDAHAALRVGVGALVGAVVCSCADAGVCVRRPWRPCATLSDRPGCDELADHAARWRRMMQNHHAAMYRRRVARSSCAVLAATGATLMQSAVSAVGRGHLTRGSSLSYHAHTHNAQAGGLLLLLHTFFPMGLATMSFAHSAAASIRPTVTPLVMGNCCRIGECGSCAPHPPPYDRIRLLGLGAPTTLAS